MNRIEGLSKSFFHLGVFGIPTEIGGLAIAEDAGSWTIEVWIGLQELLDCGSRLGMCHGVL